ncbi:hypothetical protein K438DRAFT_1748198 [Mycena galopus ATCC 62051]|nr:hypothetical protein K438DRAFT_1748198 [Mycena galopus ATCC 62051]
MVASSKADLDKNIWDQGNGHMWKIACSKFNDEEVILENYPGLETALPCEAEAYKGAGGWLVGIRKVFHRALDAGGTLGEGFRCRRLGRSLGGPEGEAQNGLVSRFRSLSGPLVLELLMINASDSNSGERKMWEKEKGSPLYVHCLGLYTAIGMADTRALASPEPIQTIQVQRERLFQPGYAQRRNRESTLPPSDACQR